MIVVGPELAVVGQALGQAEHHLRRVGRLAGPHAVAAAADHLGEYAPTLYHLLCAEELRRRAEGVADRKSQQGAAEALAQKRGGGHQRNRSRATRSKNSAW